MIGIYAGKFGGLYLNVTELDFINESSELVKDELMIRNMEKTLRDIDDALVAIEEGYYGICQKTGKSIENARLKAIPWAKYSIEGQEDIDAYENTY